MPTEYKLEQNYPNPFNLTTKIRYSIPNVTLSHDKNGTNSIEGSRVQLKIYDVLGSEIAAIVNKEKAPGNYNVSFNTSLLSNGVYFYELLAGNFVETKKLILIR